MTKLIKQPVIHFVGLLLEDGPKYVPNMTTPE